MVTRELKRYSKKHRSSTVEVDKLSFRTGLMQRDNSIQCRSDENS